MKASIGALADLGRVSNLPTCVSNVLVGLALAWALEPAPTAIHLGPVGIAGLVISVAGLYLFGMGLNDLCDVASDREESPRRPIASGRLTYAQAAWATYACLAIAAGCGAAWFRHAWPSFLGLLGLIVAYDLLHKRRPWTVLLMGACRGGVYLFAAMAASPAVGGRLLHGEPAAWSQAGLFAGLITVYVTGLTVIARAEERLSIDARKHLAPVLPLAMALAAIFVWPAGATARWAAVAAGLAMAGWLLKPMFFLAQKPPRTRHAVMAWLSGMCLVDAWFLALLGQPIWAGVAGACWAATAWGHRRILGS